MFSFSLPLIAAAEMYPETSSVEVFVSIGFLLILVGMAAVSILVEYLFSRFGSSMAVCWRYSLTAIVVALFHVFWRAWAQQTNIVEASLAPDNASFRVVIWVFLLVSWIFPGWLVYNAAQFTWFDRYLPRGFALVLLRILLCIGLAAAVIWLGVDSMNLLDGARLRI